MTEPLDLDAIPAEMIEAAAAALHEHDRLEFTGEPPWERLDESDRDSYRKSMAAALAALSVGEVRQQWRGWGAGCRWINCADRTIAMSFPHREHRTVRTFPDGSVLTTPWREVPK